MYAGDDCLFVSSSIKQGAPDHPLGGDVFTLKHNNKFSGLLYPSTLQCPNTHLYKLLYYVHKQARLWVRHYWSTAVRALTWCCIVYLVVVFCTVWVGPCVFNLYISYGYTAYQQHTTNTVTRTTCTAGRIERKWYG